MATRIFYALGLSFVTAAGPTALADTLRVPDDYSTIQVALDMSTNGDIVEIADGIYTGAGNKNLNFGGRAITVRSASGDPTACIIDCEGDGRGFIFDGGEGPDSVVEGLTVTNGNAEFGGGVHCFSSSPTFVRCVIQQNSAETYGGGVHGDEGAPTFTYCTFAANTANRRGGGLYCADGCNATVAYCRFSENAADAGGGIYGYHSSPTISRCTIRDNWALGIFNDTDGGGAGVFCFRSSPQITACRINENTASTAGGGLYASRASSPTLSQCTLRGNTATFGGGVHCYDATPTLINCVIGNNTSQRGGGIFVRHRSEPALTHCTLAANRASLGASVALASPFIWDEPSAMTMENCILWNNATEIWNNDGSTLTASYCNIRGGWPGEGNTDVDPLFAFAADAHLTPDSPCIDAGTNEPVGGLPEEDADRNPRPLDGDGDTVAIADMGAYEFNPSLPSIALSGDRFDFAVEEGDISAADQRMFVRNAGGGTLRWEIAGQPDWLTVSPAAGESNGDENEVTLQVNISGLSYGVYEAWLVLVDSQAVNSPQEVLVTLRLTTKVHVPGDHATIQAAIDAAPAGSIIALEDGIYSGPGNKNVRFGGKAVTVRSASGDPALCVIDCEGDGCGFIFENSERWDSVVEGLTIRNGTGYDRTGTGYFEGGGVHCYDASPTLDNCIIEQNSVGGDGGGFFGESCHARLFNCTIRGNTAGNEGGGIYGFICTLLVTDCRIRDNDAMQGGGVYCRRNYPTFVRCTVSENTSVRGGGICYEYCGPTVTDCTIRGNLASQRGGGGYYSGDFRHAHHINCVFDNNVAEENGGGAYCNFSTAPLFARCTFSANEAGDTGGGFYFYYADDVRLPFLTNCILWGDFPQPIYVLSSNPVVTYSNVEGGWPGEGNIDADPLFAAGPGGCFYLSQTATGQPFDSPCVDAGSDTAANLGLDALTTRRDEVTDSGTVDMGYHYPITGEPYLPGDINGDGVRDLLDYAEFGSAMTGPGPLPPGTVSGCLTAADLDDDGDIDAADFAALQILLGQPSFTN